MATGNESPYSRGNWAGHEWFHAPDHIGTNPPANPYTDGSADHAAWDHGFEQGEDDAYNAYFI